MTNSTRPDLAIIRGGRLSPPEFAALPLQDKIDYLHRLKGARKIRTILEDPAPGKLVQSLPPTDIYQILHDVGPDESLEIIQLASAGQVRFILDWELWDEWTISVDKAVEWFELLLLDEDQAATIIPRLDQELLLVFLKKTVIVGGGLGEIINSEDYQEEWDHTFDEMYYIRFIDSRNSQSVLRLIDLIYRMDNPLYRSLMQGVENELLSELEETAAQFRRGRLADEGFPSPHEAAAIYSRLAPEEFTPATDKAALPGAGELSPFPVISDDGTTLFARAFAIADSPSLRREFHYLVNTAMVAERITPADHAGMEQVLDRVVTYLTIALEYLADDVEEAARVLSGEQLQRLFSVGHSLLARLQDRGKRLSSDNYAAGRVLQGLAMQRPRFYRGLDPDRADEYRNFAGMADVRTVDAFLRGMEQG
jgi:hypothetical protein